MTAIGPTLKMLSEVLQEKREAQRQAQRGKARDLGEEMEM